MADAFSSSWTVLVNEWEKPTIPRPHTIRAAGAHADSHSRDGGFGVGIFVRIHFPRSLSGELPSSGTKRYPEPSGLSFKHFCLYLDVMGFKVLHSQTFTL